MPGFSYLTKSQPRSDDALPQVQSVALADPLAASNTASIRETIDLLELDLSAMIRDVASAAASVRSGASASAEGKSVV